MKPLILVLLSAVALEAQTPATVAPPKLAEFARKERERRIQTPLEGRVYTSDVVRKGTTSGLAVTSLPVVAPPPVSSKNDGTISLPRIGPAPKTPEAAAADASDAASKELNEKVAAQRVKVRELQDRHDTLKIQVAQFTDQYLAPVTNTNAQQAALNNLVDTQKKLDANDQELTEAQSKLRELETPRK